MSITSRHFGLTEEGKEVLVFTLANSKGIKAEITNYGGIVISLEVPDREGRPEDVVLGFERLEGYLQPGPYFGAIIGRHANRIEDSAFSLNGVTYKLANNEGKNHLHGGLKGFDKVIWEPEIIRRDGCECLQLSYLSRDGEEGYPGNLDVRVTYSVTEDNSLAIDYFAVSDKDTVVNLTNHSYFNLAGHAAGDICKHEILINADRFTAINGQCIPTGEIRDVKGTPMDLRTLTPIGPGLKSNHEQIAWGKGYDHNWVLNTNGKISEKAAEVYEKNSGRLLEVYTTKPGIQFYTGNFLNGLAGKDGVTYQKWGGLCLETQYFPNAMKHAHFPSPILKAGQNYQHSTTYRFLTR